MTKFASVDEGRGGQYIWTPCSSLENGADYALQILVRLANPSHRKSNTHNFHSKLANSTTSVPSRFRALLALPAALARSLLPLPPPLATAPPLLACRYPESETAQNLSRNSVSAS
jgi:hypothetical protein